MNKSKLIETLLRITLTSASALSATIAPMLIDKRKMSRLKNVSYGSHEDQVLDIYVPKSGDQKNLPISIIIHGGGFKYFSKDSHATAAHRLADNGRLVFNLNYRLAPKYPYPSGLIDTILAYSWIINNAARYGGDINKISLIGESAGANFALALCLYLFGIKKVDTDFKLPEIPVNKPKHAIIHCGHLHVSNVDRYTQQKDIHPVVLFRIQQIQREYLPSFQQYGNAGAGLADPLLEIENLALNKQTLPKDFTQIFVPVGDRDPVSGDSTRLAKSLEELGQKNRLRTYQGEGHAFYILPFNKSAKQCWDDIFKFLNT